MSQLFLNDAIKNLSIKLDVSDSLISSILSCPWDYFHRAQEINKSGKIRIFYSPNKEFKVLQKRIYKKILQKIPVPPSMHGYVPKHSSSTNARCHTNKRNIAKFDIEDFFPSIHYKRIEKLFFTFGFTSSEAAILTRLTTIDYCVPHGYVTSPRLACLVLTNLDKRLRHILKDGEKGTHTFYSDDVTISSNENIPDLKKAVFKAINQEGFSVKAKKYDLKKKGERKEVTGYIVNEPKINLPRQYRDELKGILHNCIISGPLIQIPTYEEKYGPLKLKKTTKLKKFKEILWGKILYVKSANEKAFKNLRQIFNKISWS